MTVKDVEKRVAKGIKWLDKRFGREKWLKKIDLSKLDLSDTNTCVIGEVMGDFGKFDDAKLTEEELGFTTVEGCYVDSQEDEYDDESGGFDTFPFLTKVWVSALSKLGAKFK